MVQTGGNTANSAANTITITPSDSAIYTALGGWLLTVLPSGFAVLQGQQNQTATPTGPFVVMTIINRRRLATNAAIYTAASQITTEPTQVSIQVGVFGDGAGEAIQCVAALWRDGFAASFFGTASIDAAPLHASEARQTGFITAERQYENQWSADLMLQVNFALTIPQQFATSIEAEIVSADTGASS